MKHLRTLGAVITVWTFCLMLIGGYVKAIHAGLACPDWPTCYGQWFPPFVDPTGFYTEHQIMAEWIHRFAASFLGPFILAFAYLAWRDTDLRPTVRWTPMLAIAILGVQVVFGGLTVTQGLQPIIVTSHLALATVFFGMILATTVMLYVAPTRDDQAEGATADTTSSPSAPTEAVEGPEVGA